MASALQLFNFQQPAQTEVPQPIQQKKRKRKVIAPIAKGIPVNYICTNCAKEITIDTNAAVQCPHCSNRIVDKLRSSKGITYTAD